jgi:putative peptide zinc metalloprotease protein
MTIVEPITAPRPLSAGGEVLALADGVELIGEYEDSGFKDPPLLARRADGQMIQLSRLLYLIAAACDGHRDADSVAAVVGEQYGRRVSSRNVRYVVERKLRPLGVLALADGTTPELPKREPVMALRHRKPIVPESYVNGVARAFTWLHRPPIQIVVLLALATFDAWLFGVHGIAGGLRAILYSPVLLLGLLASIVVATAFHEIGHASACRYGGARPGVMGVGIYLVWPAFYCDVTEAYRLNRPGRLRTDLGGVYFNGIFALAAGLAYFPTGQEALLLVAFVQHTIVLQQLLPLLRFDGYYVLSDLTGVPDILSRVKPIFRSLIPRGAPEPRVRELKPWVRVVVTAYLVVLIPTLVFMIASTVLAAPRMAATAYDSLGIQLDRLGSAHAAPQLTLAAVQIGALLLPPGAIAVSISRSGRMAARGLRAWSSDSVLRQAIALAGTAAIVGGTAYTWWPNGDYQPIRPVERGTIGDALQSLKAIPSGRPSFTKQRESQLGSAPTVREEGAATGLDGQGWVDPDAQRHSGPGGAWAPRSPLGHGPGSDSATSPAGEDPIVHPWRPTRPGPITTPTPSEPSGQSPTPELAPAPPSPSGSASPPTGTPAPTPPPSSTAAPGATSTPNAPITTPAPSAPTDPAATATPSAPSDPTATATPGDPAATATPSAPSDPTAPQTPSDPAAPPTSTTPTSVSTSASTGTDTPATTPSPSSAPAPDATSTQTTTTTTP